MILLAAALFGLAIGALMELGSAKHGRLLPSLCAAVILALAVMVLIVNYPGNWASGIIIVFSSMAGGALASGYVWKGHPLISDMSYCERVGFAWKNDRLLRLEAGQGTDPIEKVPA